MKRFCLAVSALWFLLACAHATPSTTYWTPCSPDFQPFGVWHIGVDNYFTVMTKTTDIPPAGAFPTDLGLTVGVIPSGPLQAEIGIDLMEPLNDPWFVNAKIGAAEGALFFGSPSLGLGIFNVGLNQSTQGQNIIHLAIGKDFGAVGRLHACPFYTGSFSKLGLGSDDTGFMIGYDKSFMPVNDATGQYNKWVFAADYASGNNALGGGGFGIYHYFTKTISLLTGPVFFNNQPINGKWKWTVQLDINV